MAKTKQKIVAEEQKTARKAGQPAPRAKSATREAKLEQSEMLTFWKQEVKALRSQTFSSQDEAINTLLGRVLTKMNTPKELVEPTKVFLKDLFETDPELLQDLKETLAIK